MQNQSQLSNPVMAMSTIVIAHIFCIVSYSTALYSPQIFNSSIKTYALQTLNDLTVHVVNFKDNNSLTPPHSQIQLFCPPTMLRPFQKFAAITVDGISIAVIPP